jgi:hypothetical protein
MMKVIDNNAAQYITAFTSETPIGREAPKNRYEQLENRISLFSSKMLHFLKFHLFYLILDELETLRLLMQKDNEFMSIRASDSYSEGKGNNPSVGHVSC